MTRSPLLSHPHRLVFARGSFLTCTAACTRCRPAAAADGELSIAPALNSVASAGTSSVPSGSFRCCRSGHAEVRRAGGPRALQSRRCQPRRPRRRPRPATRTPVLRTALDRRAVPSWRAELRFETCAAPRRPAWNAHGEDTETTGVLRQPPDSPRSSRPRRGRRSGRRRRLVTALSSRLTPAGTPGHAATVPPGGRLADIICPSRPHLRAVRARRDPGRDVRHPHALPHVPPPAPCASWHAPPSPAIADPALRHPRTSLS